jgi:hypothetical protein
MTGLYLAAAIETKDFEKEMNGLGYPYKCCELPFFEYKEFGNFIPFLLTDEAIKNDYDWINYVKENEDEYDDKYIPQIEAQIEMRRSLRTWINDDIVLVHYTW